MTDLGKSVIIGKVSAPIVHADSTDESALKRVENRTLSVIKELADIEEEIWSCSVEGAYYAHSSSVFSGTDNRTYKFLSKYKALRAKRRELLGLKTTLNALYKKLRGDCNAERLETPPGESFDSTAALGGWGSAKSTSIVYDKRHLRRLLTLVGVRSNFSIDDIRMSIPDVAIRRGHLLGYLKLAGFLGLTLDLRPADDENISWIIRRIFQAGGVSWPRTRKLFKLLRHAELKEEQLALVPCIVSDYVLEIIDKLLKGESRIEEICTVDGDWNQAVKFLGRTKSNIFVHRENLRKAFLKSAESCLGEGAKQENEEVCQLCRRRLAAEYRSLRLSKSVLHEVEIRAQMECQKLVALANNSRALSSGESGEDGYHSIGQEENQMQELQIRLCLTVDMARRTMRNLNQIRERADVLKKRILGDNLRLVIRTLPAYVDRGLEKADLIQEGFLGLFSGIEHFDHTIGVQFASYGTQWVRQAIGRAIDDQARLIRLPVHVSEKVSRVKKKLKELSLKLGRSPTRRELAEYLGIHLKEIMMLERVSQRTASIKTIPTDVFEYYLEIDKGEKGDIESNPLLKLERREAAEVVSIVLDTLPKEMKRVIEYRYGFKDGYDRTLEEIGEIMNLTRERIRQIEKIAMEQLKHPSRKKRLSQVV